MIRKTNLKFIRQLESYSKIEHFRHAPKVSSLRPKFCSNAEIIDVNMIWNILPWGTEIRDKCKLLTLYITIVIIKVKVEERQTETTQNVPSHMIKADLKKRVFNISVSTPLSYSAGLHSVTRLTHMTFISFLSASRYKTLNVKCDALFHPSFSSTLVLRISLWTLCHICCLR